MKVIKTIVETNSLPNRTDVGWLHNNTLKFFTNGEWREVVSKEENLPIIEEKESRYNKNVSLDVIINESLIGKGINSSLENKIKTCARIIIARVNRTTKDTYYVIYNRMDSDDNVFVNVGLNENNKIAASVLYLDTKSHMITFD